MMIRARYFWPTFLIAAGSLPAAPPPLVAQTAADQWLRVSPAIVGGLRDPTPALRVQLELDHSTINLERLPRRLLTSVHANLPLTYDADRSPESVRVDAAVGLLTALIRTPPVVPGQAPSLDPPRRWGFLELGVQMSMEATQRVEDADLMLGGVVAYEHDQDRLWFVPHLEMSVGLVDCLGCQVPAEESSWSRRVEVQGGWSLPIGEVLRLRPEGRWFRGWGIGEALAGVREEEGTWGSLELAYAVDRVDWLHEVHLAWRGGEVPVRLAERSAWSFGVTVVP